MSFRDKVGTVVKNKRFQIAAVSLISFAGGGVAGYYAALKIMAFQFEQALDHEIEQTRLYFAQRDKTGSYSDPAALAEDLGLVDEEDIEPTDEAEIREAIKVIQDHQYTPYDKVEPVDTDVAAARASIAEHIQENPPANVVNVFINNDPEKDDDFDIDDELAKKREGRPYIIEEEQFFENEAEHKQSALEYFELDETLVDEENRPIHAYVQVIGPDNLHFGRGAKDRHMVYIRNDRLKHDYEVSRNEGSYAEEVLGSSLQHADYSKGLRRFRPSDE